MHIKTACSGFVLNILRTQRHMIALRVVCWWGHEANRYNQATIWLLAPLTSHTGWRPLHGRSPPPSPLPNPVPTPSHAIHTHHRKALFNESRVKCTINRSAASRKQNHTLKYDRLMGMPRSSAAMKFHWHYQIKFLASKRLKIWSSFHSWQTPFIILSNGKWIWSTKRAETSIFSLSP